MQRDLPLDGSVDTRLLDGDRVRVGEIAERVAGLLHGQNFRVYTSDDLAGVQVGGACKNVMAIAAGIIHRPSILFLDEPTTGIDVASARQIRQMLADLNDAGSRTAGECENRCEIQIVCKHDISLVLRPIHDSTIRRARITHGCPVHGLNGVLIEDDNPTWW